VVDLRMDRPTDALRGVHRLPRGRSSHAMAIA
jgi:hypothetical protein